MAEITLDQLSTESKIERTTLLKRIKQSYPDYDGQPIDGLTAGKWIAPLRKAIPSVMTPNNQVLTLHENSRLMTALRKIADQGSPVPLTKQTTTGGTAPVNGRDQHSNFSRGNNPMNNHDTEYKAKQNWEADLSLQADFGGNFDAYLAFYKAEKNAKNKSGNAHA